MRGQRIGLFGFLQVLGGSRVGLSRGRLVERVLIYIDEKYCGIR